MSFSPFGSTNLAGIRSPIRGLKSFRSSKEINIPAPAQLWNPSNLITTSAAIWLDADDSDTITLSDNNITEWADKSGNDNHATSVGPNFFTVASEEVNGLNAVRSPGTASALRWPSPATFNAKVIMMVWKWRTPNSDYEHPWGSAGDYHGGPSAAANSDVFGNLGGKYGWNATLRRSGTLVGTCTTNLKRSTTPQQFSLTIATTAINNFTELGHASSGNRAPSVDYCEVLAFEAAPIEQEFFLLEGYLHWKWGLQDDLPIDHPYKNSAPVLSAGPSNLNFIESVQTSLPWSYFRMDETASPLENSGYESFTLTASGSPVYRDVSILPGQTNNITFNGSSLFIGTGTNWVNLGTFSFMFALKKADSTPATAQGLIHVGDFASSVNRGFYIQYNENGSISIIGWASGNFRSVTTLTQAILSDEESALIHITVTPTTFKIYKNGTFIENVDHTWTFNNNTATPPVRIGCVKGASNQNFYTEGMGHVAVWTRELSSNEISDMATKAL